MAMKKIAVLHEICTCLSKVIILKLNDSVKANLFFFWQKKKKKGIFFTYTGGCSSIGTGHHAMISQVLRVALYCTHLPVWTPVEKEALIQQTRVLFHIESFHMAVDSSSNIKQRFWHYKLLQLSVQDQIMVLPHIINPYLALYLSQQYLLLFGLRMKYFPAKFYMKLHIWVLV